MHVDCQHFISYSLVQKKQQQNLVRATRGYSPIPLLGEQLYQIWPFS